MNIIEAREQYMDKFKRKWRNGWLPRRDIEKIIDLNKENADILASFNYNIYYDYRDIIMKQDDYTRALCFVWWYFENYHFGKGDHNLGIDYTFRLCKHLKLDTKKVAEITYAVFDGDY
jgi:hypothetical protein